MNINSMISVKVAAAMLGRDKKYVREKLDQGLYKGEKRLDGDKERWFVQRKDVEAELADMPIVTPDGTYHPKQGFTPAEPSSAGNSLTPPVTPEKRRRKSTTKARNDMFFGVDVQTVETKTVETQTVETPAVEIQLIEQAVVEASVISETIEIPVAERLFESAIEEVYEENLGADLTSYIPVESFEPLETDAHSWSFTNDSFSYDSNSLSFSTESHGANVDGMSASFETEIASALSSETDYFDSSIEEAVRDALKAQVIVDAISKANDAPSMMTLVQVMSREFARRLEDHRLINARLVEEIEDRNMQLRLLPDLQKRANEVFRLEFEAASLRLQIDSIERKQFETIAALERAEQEMIPQLEARLEEEYRMHSIEVARLREQISDLSERAKVDKRNRATIIDLENALYDMIESKERDRREAQAEIERLLAERELQIRMLEEERQQELERLRIERDNEFKKIAEESERLKREKEEELAQIAQFTAQYQRQKEYEIARLVDEADLIAQEKEIIRCKLDERLAQIAEQAQSIEKLETDLRQTEAYNEKLKAEAKEESERVAREMGSEITALNERVSKLTEQLEVSKMPWWKRWFMPTA